MKPRLLVTAISLFFIANPALAEIDYSKYLQSEQHFIDNRVGLKCLGESSRSSSDFTLLGLGYTAREIIQKEKELATQINSIINKKGYCEKYRADYKAAGERMKNDGVDYDKLFEESLAEVGVQVSTTKSKPRTPNQSQTQSASDAHTVCLEARDYEGCLKVKSGLGEIVEETCDSRGWCQVEGKGRDRYGFIKPIGWWYKELSDGILYMNTNKVSRIPHKGQASRYIVMPKKWVYYQRTVFPTSKRIGNSNTNCTGYGSTINCTTTPATTFSTPGIGGGARGVSYDDVYDCKDKTTASFRNGKRMGGIFKSWGKWTKFTPSKALKKWCKNAADLPVRNMKL